MRRNRKTRKNVVLKKGRLGNIVPGIKYFIFIVFPVVALVVLIYFVSVAVNSAFNIRNVVFAGNEHLTDEELRNLAGLDGGESLIGVSGRKISEKMIESPWIRSASVRKEFPDKLNILVKEAEPFALLDIKGRLFIVDDRGRMLQELRDSPIPFLPIISGTPFGKKEALSEALSLARAIKDKGLIFEKDHIEIIAHKPQEMAVNIDGVIVKVGTGEYEDKLFRLAELEEEIKKRNIHVDYIDLRFANRAIVKPVNEVIN
ncbi:MAG: FtsQ-type POTRA domain-containing protein [Nitrospirota bacterium]